MVATYSASPGDQLIPGSSSVTEWDTKVGGVIAACGEAALTVLLSLTKGTPNSTGEVTNLTQTAVNKGWTVGTYAYAGQSSPETLSNLANTQGVTLQNLPYQTALQQYAGKRPIVLGLSDAAAFGGGDAGVQGHYVTVVGKTSSGDYIVSDPNQPESTSGKLVVYTGQEIANAQPFSAQVPTTGPSGLAAVSNPTNGASGGTFSLTDPSTWLSGITSGIFSSLGIVSLQDFLWRTGFVLLGMVLIVLGLVVTFQRQAEEGIGTVVGAAAKAG